MAVKKKKNYSEIESLANFPEENSSPVLRISKQGKVLFANAAALKEFPEIKINNKISKRWTSYLKDVHDIKTKIEIEIENKTYSLNITPIINQGYSNLYVEDITEKKKTEETIRKSETKYERF